MSRGPQRRLPTQAPRTKTETREKSGAGGALVAPWPVLLGLGRFVWLCLVLVLVVVLLSFLSFSSRAPTRKPSFKAGHPTYMAVDSVRTGYLGMATPSLSTADFGQLSWCRVHFLLVRS